MSCSAGSRRSSPGMRCERGARGERQPLRVAQVAGVLEGDRDRERVVRRLRWQRREQLVHVANARRERLGPLGVDRVVAQQPAELLQVRAAPGGVDDDRLEARERVDDAAGEPSALVEPARVHGERAAAALRRRDDLEALGRQDACGGGVDVAEEHPLDAAGEDADAPAGGPRRAAVAAGACDDERQAGARSSIGLRPGRRWAAAGRAARAAARAASARGREASRTGAPRCSRSARVRAARASRRRGASPRSAGRTGRPTGTSDRHAMQPRQRSKCSTTVAARGATVPSSVASISWMRPRGESISSCHERVRRARRAGRSRSARSPSSAPSASPSPSGQRRCIRRAPRPGRAAP